MSAQLEELDALAGALVEAAGQAAVLVARAVRAVHDPRLLAAAPVDPGGVALVVLEVGRGAGELSRAAAALAALASAVAAAVAGYRVQEAALAALARDVPHLVGTFLRAHLLASAVLAGPAVPLVAGVVVGVRVARAPEPADSPVLMEVREAGVGVVVRHPGVVDGAVRIVPGLLGVRDVPAAAGLVGMLGQASGTFVEGGAVTGTMGPSAPCAGPGGVLSGDRRRVGRPGPGGATGRPASGVADLLRRGQGVAAWRSPRPGEHDPLPVGQARPPQGQVRIDQVVGDDGAAAWVVHVPGTQDWDGDGEGSPMDMAANVALVAGRPTAVVSGVSAALVAAGVRPGDPVLLVGHSQGGMTALDLAADPSLRRVATVTHVITAGSPVTGRTPPPGVQVLALEHDDDLVPRLDGRDHADRADRVVVRAPAPDGPWGTDAVPAHSSSAYVVTAESVDASTHPSLVSYREGLAPFLDREGASCSSRHVVLRRAEGPDGGLR